MYFLRRVPARALRCVLARGCVPCDVVMTSYRTYDVTKYFFCRFVSVHEPTKIYWAGKSVEIYRQIADSTELRLAATPITRYYNSGLKKNLRVSSRCGFGTLDDLRASSRCGVGGV